MSAIETELKNVDTAAADERWKDATSAFKSAETSMAKPYAEYEKQSKAKKDYEFSLGQVNARLDKLAEPGLENETTKSASGQIDTNLISAASQTDSRDYVEALSMLRLNDPEMARLETEVVRLEAAQEKTQGQLDLLNGRIEEVGPRLADFEELSERATAFDTEVANIATTMDSCDFTAAQAQISSADYELDALEAEMTRITAEREAEEARKAAEKEEWDRRVVRWDDLVAKIQELTAWRDGEAVRLGMMQDVVQGHIDTEEYRLACDALDQAETAIAEPWAAHQKQVEAKATYEVARTKLDQRAADASASEYLFETATAQLKDIETILQRMTDLAAENDFVAANDETEAASAKFDTLEQTLRENRIRAKVAEEMGLSPDSTDPQIEAEVQRRLYEEERALLEGRMADARRNPPLGAEVDLLLDQLDTDLVSIQAMADGGDPAGAVEGIRTATRQMTGIDEMIRDQMELKRRYETAHTEASGHAARLSGSAFRTIAEAADAIAISTSEAEEPASKGDYAAALAKAEAWSAELDDLDKRADAMAVAKADAEAKQTALAPRIQVARDNDHAEIQPAATVIVDKADAADKHLEAEAYQAALDAYVEIEKLLPPFEEEAENARQYKQYEADLAILDLDPDLMDMRSTIFPEVDLEKSDIETKEAARLSAEDSGDWKTARDTAFEERDLLDAFKLRVAEIGSAKDSFDAVAPDVRKELEGLFPSEPDPTGTVKTYQDSTDAIVVRMDFAESQGRWLEAVDILEELSKEIDAARIAIRDAFQASDSVINDFIKTKVDIVKNALFGGMLTAINQFETMVLDHTTSERSGQKAVRWGGYVLDIASAWTGVVDKLGVLSAILSTVKVAAEATATEVDDAMDNKDKEVAKKLIADLRKAQTAVSKNWKSDVGPWFKSNDAEAYKKIGNKLHEMNKDPSGAAADLEAAGVPLSASMTDFNTTFYKQLEGEFKRQRG